LIERKDGETDASWIGRLEAAYKALIPACEKLQEKLDKTIEGAALVYSDLKVEADASNAQLTDVINERAQFAYYLGMACGLLQRAKTAIGDLRDQELIQQIDDHLKSVSQWRYPPT
jgi:hypothetical protein